MTDAIMLLAMLIAIVASLYAVYTARRTRALLENVLEAASLRERIARSLARARVKPKHRYIVFEVASSRRVPRDELARKIREVATKTLGLTGLVDSGLQLIEYDESTRRGILRVRHTYKYHALAILGLVREVSGERVLLVPLATSGTLRKARKEARRRSA